MDDLMLPLPEPECLGETEWDDIMGYTADQMREYAKKAVEAERQRCSQLAILCSWEVVGAENALRVAALDEVIRNPPLDKTSR